jgi:prepilin-type processing-associated H-X9-DG protein
LLLPAIQAAREAARRTECKNRLKQMGLSVLNHVDSLKIFPTGGTEYSPRIEDYVTNGQPNGAAKQGLGWAYQILPYLEEGAIRSLTTYTQLQKVNIPMYACPSRRSATVVFSINNGNGLTSIIDYAAAQPCTIQCHSGTPGCGPVEVKYTPSQSFTAASYSTNLTSFWGGRFQQKKPGPAANSIYDGVIVRTPWDHTAKATVTGWSPIGMGKITDGTSKTLLIGEKYLRQDLYPGGISYSDDQGWCEGWDLDVMRSTCFPPMADGDPLGYSFQPLNTASDYFGAVNDVVNFGSAHTGGFNCVFVDGSVHTLNYDIDVTVFNALGTRAGGEAVDTSTVN